GKGGCDLIAVDGDGKTFTAKKKVESKELQNMHGGVVLVDKYLFGADSDRSWKAVEFANPKNVGMDSERNGAGAGSLVCADGMLYLVSEKDGTVTLLEADPKNYSPQSSFNLPQQSKIRPTSGAIWTHPVVANGRLYLRDQELIFCYDVKAK